MLFMICSRSTFLARVGLRPRASPFMHYTMDTFGRAPFASAQDTAASLQGLEAEKKLLEASQQRSSTEAQDNFKEKCRVSAELEALQKIQAAKCAHSVSKL